MSIDNSILPCTAPTADLEQQPGTALGFIDPLFNQARHADVPMLFAHDVDCVIRWLRIHLYHRHGYAAVGRPRQALWGIHASDARLPRDCPPDRLSLLLRRDRKQRYRDSAYLMIVAGDGTQMEPQTRRGNSRAINSVIRVVSKEFARPRLPLRSGRSRWLRAGQREWLWSERSPSTRREARPRHAPGGRQRTQ